MKMRVQLGAISWCVQTSWSSCFPDTFLLKSSFLLLLLITFWEIHCPKFESLSLQNRKTAWYAVSISKFPEDATLVAFDASSALQGGLCPRQMSSIFELLMYLCQVMILWCRCSGDYCRSWLDDRDFHQVFAPKRCRQQMRNTSKMSLKRKLFWSGARTLGMLLASVGKLE